MYEIIPNHFAMKYWDEKLKIPIQLHAISYNKCNFKCGYCNFSNRSFTVKEYDDVLFVKVIKKLLKDGIYFKFTGGEPTLNPQLYTHLKMIKKMGGKVFLDTNGSRPDIVEKLCSENLIEVVGLSLKGVTCEMAKENAGVLVDRLVWDNFFETLDIVCKYNLKVIVTYVVYSGIDLANIEALRELLEPYQNVIMKINNLLPCSHQGGSYLKIQEDMLLDYMQDFVVRHPLWKGRVTLINDSRATSEFGAVIFL